MFISSERVWNDLSVALEFREKRGWNQNFVVRQWFDIECDMVPYLLSVRINSIHCPSFAFAIRNSVAS
jgi:hypothetical protein